ncbi:CBS domain-containing protein [Anaeromyxobacter diazotrophicus]|uniref:Inosine-5-monophosphate dehydrogenase n=1 Tax=Anaeromyxobacter diazotrophicus TaxID=2590199 RepID=A0A7I9VLQ0_9BACT|nr:CBS domain-containing protein [Anaeromyxobacter diazotrophicus]GEJ56917.1 inosine-5-monophosphate dehydrogenase [Anaeromyxobacter diazotrophicus]
MLVKHAMTRGVTTIGPGETLQAAAQAMRACGVGFLPVREDDHLVGAITDRDVVVRAVAPGRDPRRTVVREAMTPRLVLCHEDDTLGEAARQMEEHAVRRILVLDGAERLVGVLSADDLSLHARGLAVDVLERCHDPGRLARPSWLPIE